MALQGGAGLRCLPLGNRFPSLSCQEWRGHTCCLDQKSPAPFSLLVTGPSSVYPTPFGREQKGTLPTWWSSGAENRDLGDLGRNWIDKSPGIETPLSTAIPHV